MTLSPHHPITPDTLVHLTTRPLPRSSYQKVSISGRAERLPGETARGHRSGWNRDTGDEVAAMHNFYANEVEAEFRRQEWQQRAAAHERVARAEAVSKRLRWPRLPRLTVSGLLAPIAPRPSLTTCHAPRLAEC
jgi:hypothetical protein